MRMSVKYLLLGIVIVMVVPGDTLETETDEKHLARSTRSIISTLVDGLKNIHANLHKKQDTPEKDVTTNSDTLDEVVVADNRGCRVEYVVVESVLYSDVMITECRSHNLTSCHTEPYEECDDQLRKECHQRVREECHDMLEEECYTQYRTEH